MNLKTYVSTVLGLPGGLVIAATAGLAGFACEDDDNTSGGTPGTGGSSNATGGTTSIGGSVSTPYGDNAKGEGVTLVVEQTNLVSNQEDMGMTTDPNLVNPWGLVANPTAGFFWVANAGSGIVSVYPPTGGASIMDVPVPGLPDQDTSSPTGQVFNATLDFMGDRFIVDTEDGTIAGWQTQGQPFVLRVDNSADSRYKGLALVPDGPANLLVATNFGKGTVDVFDASYTAVESPGFVDEGSPTIPPTYAPFNVAYLGGMVYITYAQQDEDAEDDVKGPGHGYVSTFMSDGTFVKRLVSEGALDSPWGLAIAPLTWQDFAGALLVGNFGDGRINAYDTQTGALMGSLATATGPLSIDGLWAIVAGPKLPSVDGGPYGGGVSSSDFSGSLFFTAGPNDEADGVFGKLDIR